MNNPIQQLHLEAIENNISTYQLCNDDDPIMISGKEKAAAKSSEVTEIVATDFAKWCALNYVPTIVSRELKYWQKGTYQNKEYFYSTQELFHKYPIINKHEQPDTPRRLFHCL